MHKVALLSLVWRGETTKVSVPNLSRKMLTFDPSKPLGLFFSAVTAARQFDKYSLLAHGLQVIAATLTDHVGKNELRVHSKRSGSSAND